MNTPAQPLDHRTFLQQYLLACAAAGQQECVVHAQNQWDGIERAVAKAEAANSTQSLQSRYNVPMSKRP